MAYTMIYESNDESSLAAVEARVDEIERSRMSAMVYRTSSQVINANTYTAIGFNAVGWSTHTQDGRPNYAFNNGIVVPVNGIYHVSAVVPWNYNSSGVRQVYIIRNRNGSNSNIIGQENAPFGGTIILNVAGHVQLNAADRLYINVWHNATAGTVEASWDQVATRASLAVSLVRAL